MTKKEFFQHSKVREKYPVYMAGVQAYLQVQATKLRRMIADKRLNRTEKSLLEARLARRDGKLAQAQEILENAQVACSDVFLLGEIHSQLANIFGMRGKWQESLAQDLRALDCFQRIGDRRGECVSNYNAFVSFARQGLDTVALAYLDAARRIAVLSSEKTWVASGTACHLSAQLDFAGAIREIESVLGKRGELNGIDRSTLEAVAADLYFRNGDAEKSLALLTKLTKAKDSWEKPRVFLEYYLLKKLIRERAPYRALPKVPKSLKENREFFLQWQVVQAMLSGDQAQAEQFWKELVQLLPEVFRPGFAAASASDEKSIFFTFLRQIYRASKLSLQADMAKSRDKLTSLRILLSEAAMPLRKEDLIEQIWGTEYSPAMDARFYKLIERFKAQTGAKLVNVNRSYLLLP